MMYQDVGFIRPYFGVGRRTFGGESISFYAAALGVELDEDQFACVIIIREPYLVVREKPVRMVDEV